MQPPNAQVSSNEGQEVELHCICPALARKKASLIRPGLHGILAVYRACRWSDAGPVSPVTPAHQKSKARWRPLA